MREEKKIHPKKFYDQEAADYIHMYEKDYIPYPANAIRLDLVLKRLEELKTKTVLDAGCGTCGPMIRLLQNGLDCKGFDYSEEMVFHGKKELEKNGFDPNLIFVGDLEKGIKLENEKFDSVLALGVFPHIPDELKALNNMNKLLNENGKVFIEFRNDLFSTFTFNVYTVEFYLKRVLDFESIPKNLKNKVSNFFKEVCKTTNQDTPKYFTKFNNPLTISKDLFKPAGFKIDDMSFYHYHALPPIFETIEPKIFKELSLKMENPHDWRGYLMASAFVIEASKIE